MKTNTRTLLLPALAAGFLLCAGAWADSSSDSSMSDSSMSGNQPGYSGQGYNEPGYSGQDQNAQNQNAMNDQQDMQKTQAKAKIAPHTVTIQTELQSAIDEVKGMRAQLKAIDEQKPSADTLEHVKMHSKEMNSSLKMAATHEEHLKSAAKTLPVVAQSDEYKSVESAIKSAEQLNQSWQQKAKSDSYWTNKTQALNDLDNLEKKFNDALDKSKDLNSKFDIKSFT